MKWGDVAMISNAEKCISVHIQLAAHGVIFRFLVFLFQMRDNKKGGKATL